MKLKKRKSAWDISVTTEPFDTETDEHSPPVVDVADDPDLTDSGASRKGKDKDTTSDFEDAVEELDEFYEMIKEGDKPESEGELHVTFDELGFSPPYVDEFKREYGSFPTLSVQKYCKLPLRYNDPRSGAKKFRMHSVDSGREIKVTGSESGKKVPVNIVCKHREGEFVLEPKMIDKFCKVVNPDHPSFKSSAKKPLKDKPRKRKTSSKPRRDDSDTKKLKEIMEKRKKEAKFAL